MPVSSTTLKRLFAKSNNRCALCSVFLVQGENVVAEICHIRARRKGGPRYDPSLTAAERNEAPNLILLCPTCHTLADKDAKNHPVDRLMRVKAEHEKSGAVEMTKEISELAMRVVRKFEVEQMIVANATRGGVAVTIARDNNAPIKIVVNGEKKGYPANSIGADANMTNYVEYLCGLYVDYTAIIYPDEGQRWALIGKQIKSKFRLKKRTRHHLSAERFHDLVAYLIHEKLPSTPVGRKHIKNGTPMCRSFDEFRHGPM